MTIANRYRCGEMGVAHVRTLESALQPGSFGIGAQLDLRGTIYETGAPSDLFSTGTVTGLAAGGPSHLDIPGLTDTDMGILRSDMHWSDSTAGVGLIQTFTRSNGEKYVRGVVDANTWGSWLAVGQSSDENAIWSDRAALLDPDAYEWVIGTNWTRTVPAGETWYLVNAWYVTFPGSSGFMFNRVADASQESAIPLPAGTTIQANGTQTAFAYICKPSLVNGDARYSDGRSLFFERLARSRQLPFNQITCNVPAASAQGYLAKADFPTDFTRGLLTWISLMDVAWLGLQPGINLWNEISDDHQNRAGVGTLLPFSPSTFTGIQARAGSVTGEATGFSSIAGYAGVGYVKLPADW